MTPAGIDVTGPQPTPEPRRRLRDLGIVIGSFEPGPLNAITDVSGVRVGDATVMDGAARTGVTAVLPGNGDVFMDRMTGGAFILNGAGEMSGLIQVMEWGLLETPILLTNTLSVGLVSSAAVRYIVDRYPGVGDIHDVIIPVVGECDDSHLNDITGAHVTAEHVYEALNNARSGRVQEGSVGGGTGMVSFDLKGGIGTSSRVVSDLCGDHTVGVLVMSNVGRLEDLRVDGVPIGADVAGLVADEERRRTLYGSIIAVLATDAPLSAHQLARMCKRVALGIGRVGSYAAHGSGEIVIGFSTANRLPRMELPILRTITHFGDRFFDPLYRAAIEATEEAMLNAMCMAEPMVGIRGNSVPALPLAEVERIFALERGWRRAAGPSSPTG